MSTALLAAGFDAQAQGNAGRRHGEAATTEQPAKRRRGLGNWYASSSWGQGPSVDAGRSKQVGRNIQCWCCQRAVGLWQGQSSQTGIAPSLSMRLTAAGAGMQGQRQPPGLSHAPPTLPAERQRPLPLQQQQDSPVGAPGAVEQPAPSPARSSGDGLWDNGSPFQAAPGAFFVAGTRTAVEVSAQAAKQAADWLAKAVADLPEQAAAQVVPGKELLQPGSRGCEEPSSMHSAPAGAAAVAGTLTASQPASKRLASCGGQEQADAAAAAGPAAAHAVARTAASGSQEDLPDAAARLLQHGSAAVAALHAPPVRSTRADKTASAPDEPGIAAGRSWALGGGWGTQDALDMLAADEASQLCSATLRHGRSAGGQPGAPVVPNAWQAAPGQLMAVPSIMPEPRRAECVPDTLALGSSAASEGTGPGQLSPGAALVGASEHAGGRAHVTCQQATADNVRQPLAPMQLAPRPEQLEGSPAGFEGGRQPQAQPAALSEAGFAKGVSAGGELAAACASQQAGLEGTQQPPAQAAAPHEAGFAIGVSAGAWPAAAHALRQHGAGRDLGVSAGAETQSAHALQQPTGTALFTGSSGRGSVQTASALVGTAGGAHQAGSVLSSILDRQAQGLDPAARQKLDHIFASSEQALEAMLQKGRSRRQPLKLQERAAGGFKAPGLKSGRGPKLQGRPAAGRGMCLRQQGFGPAASAAGTVEAPVTASTRPQGPANGPAPAAAAEAASLAASRLESQACRTRQLPGCDAVSGQEQAAEVAHILPAAEGPAALEHADSNPQPAVLGSAEELPDIPDTMEVQPTQEYQSAPGAGSVPVSAAQEPMPASQQQQRRGSLAAADLPDIPDTLEAAWAHAGAHSVTGTVAELPDVPDTLEAVHMTQARADSATAEPAAGPGLPSAQQVAGGEPPLALCAAAEPGAHYGQAEAAVQGSQHDENDWAHAAAPAGPLRDFITAVGDTSGADKPAAGPACPVQQASMVNKPANLADLLLAAAANLNTLLPEAAAPSSEQARTGACDAEGKVAAAHQAAGQLQPTAGKFASGVLLQTESQFLDIDLQHMGPAVTAGKQAAEQSPGAADAEAHSPQLGDALPPGLQLASGKRIVISEAARQRVRHVAGEPEQEQATEEPAATQDCSSELLDELPPAGLQLGAGKHIVISPVALQEVRPMIPRQPARATVLGICSGPLSFKTGGNKPLQISAAAQARAHDMFADLDKEGSAPSLSAATMLELAVGAHLPRQNPEAVQDIPGREAGAGGASRSQSPPASAPPRATSGSAPSADTAQADVVATAGSTASGAAPQAEGMAAAPTAGPDASMALQTPVLRGRSRQESPSGRRMQQPSRAENAATPPPSSGLTATRVTGHRFRSPRGSGVSLECSLLQSEPLKQLLRVPLSVMQSSTQELHVRCTQMVELTRLHLFQAAGGCSHSPC